MGKFKAGLCAFILVLSFPAVSFAYLYGYWLSIGISCRWGFDMGSNGKTFSRGAGLSLGLESSFWMYGPGWYDERKYDFYIEPGIEYIINDKSLIFYSEIGTMLIGAGPFIGWNFKERLMETGIQTSVWAGLVFVFVEPKFRLYLDSFPEWNKMIGCPSIGLVGKLPLIASFPGGFP